MTLIADRGQLTSSILDLMTRLYPTRRSITGQGNRVALEMVRSIVPSLEFVEVPSGTPLFDWTTPPEWNYTQAYLMGPEGKVVDADDSPLHVVGYSIPVDEELDLEELQLHLHSDPDRPHVIPYRTSYYTPDWGFCLPHSVREKLPPGRYHAFIGAEHDPNGALTYGDATIGDGSPQFILSTHICHPAQANDNLSVIAVLAHVASLLDASHLRHTVRALFLPGGIGSLAWLKTNENQLDTVVGGLSLACLGDGAPLRLKATRSGNTIVDRAARLAAKEHGQDLEHEPFSAYGFDERNFSSPGINIPYGCVTRSQHGGYLEYHSSDDSIEIMSSEQLVAAVEYVIRVVEIIDTNRRLLRTEPRGEPQLGRRGLYGSVGGLTHRPDFESALLWVANLSDGEHDLIDIAVRSGIDFTDIAAAADALTEAEVTYEAGQAAAQSTSG